MRISCRDSIKLGYPIHSAYFCGKGTLTIVDASKMLPRNFKKVVFIVPRFHTNMIGWILGLQSLGLATEIWVDRVGKSEDHRLIKPLVLTQGYLSFRTAFSISHWREAFFCFRNRLIMSNADYLIFRLELNAKSLFQFIIILHSKVPFVVYQQWPINGLRGFRRVFRGMLLILFRVPIISPILSLDSDWCFKKNTYLASNLLHFIPFALQSDVSSNSTLVDRTYDSPINILTVGKFQPRKQHLELVEFLLDSANDVANRFNLKIVGEISSSEHAMYFSQIQDLLRTQEHFIQVELIANLTYEESLKTISECDVFVLISENEPASISNLEAMSKGKLVIVMKGNGTANYTDKGLGGFILNDVSELQQIFEQIHRDSSLIRRMGDFNLGVMSEHCSPRLVATQIMSVLENHRTHRFKKNSHDQN